MSTKKDKSALDVETLYEVFPLKEGSIERIVPNNTGHINYTFHIFLKDETGQTAEESYILQRINTYVFKNPAELMENIVRVSDFIRKKAVLEGNDPKRETLVVIKTRDGKDFFVDDDGKTWRMYTNINDTYCLNKVDNPEQFYESARAFGQFQNRLGDFDTATLHETIIDFHDTRVRYDNFIKALEANSEDRAKFALPEIEFVKARKDIVSHLMDRQEAGILPIRVTHNDTKLNNVLFDSNTDKAIAVIDLDTVMPGLSVNDYGDAIRFGASTGAEDEADLSKINIDFELFEAFTKGFIETAGPILTEAEKEDLLWGAKLMTFECGIRFLADYLEGDIYFNVSYPEHNLIRSRTQFKLVQDMEKHEEKLVEIINKYL